MLKRAKLGIALVVIGVVNWYPSVEAAQTDYNIGEPAGSELNIGLGPRPVAMGEAFVSSSQWNDDEQQDYPKRSSGVIFRQGIRATTLGGTGLVLWDEDSELSLFNMGNTAGLAFEDQANRLDIGGRYDSLDTLSLGKPGSEYQGATFWLHDTWVGNAFLLATFPYEISYIYGGLRTAFYVAEMTVVGLRVNIFGISEGSEEYPARGAKMSQQISLGHRFGNLLGDGWDVDLGAVYSSDGRTKQYDLDALLLAMQDLQIGLSLQYQDNPRAILDAVMAGTVEGKMKVLNARDYEITFGALFEMMGKETKDESCSLHFGAGIKLWQWLLLAGQIGKQLGDSGVDIHLGLEITPINDWSVRFGICNARLTASIGFDLTGIIKVDTWVGLDPWGFDSGLGLTLFY